ncbi:MAG: hypothetical protein P4L42_09850 [Desulfocapsaceae bacterium]|nr:hypothetical protein [Desulfocapsaceae bacterium]
MNNNPEDLLHWRQLQMVGRLLAGFSHELKNHLAVIKESNGLISDFLGMGCVQDEALQAKLLHMTGTINNRILLVAEMVNHLNGFAHRNDALKSPFQINDVLNEELTFLTRSAEMKSLRIATSFQESLPVIFNSPFVVQFIFASVFFHLLATLKPGGRILISSGQQDDAVIFEVRPEGEAAETAPGLDAVDHDQALQMALQAVGARLSTQSADGRIRTMTCAIPGDPLG